METPLLRVLDTDSVLRFRRQERRVSFAHAPPPRTRWAALKIGPGKLANARMLAGKMSSNLMQLWSELITAIPINCRPFVLLAGTTIGLLIIIIGSVGLLYKVGETELPSTLTGTVGGGLKRD